MMPELKLPNAGQPGQETREGIDEELGGKPVGAVVVCVLPRHKVSSKRGYCTVKFTARYGGCNGRDRLYDYKTKAQY